ncbi:MAG: hypothetical protein JOZ43_08805 [Acidobacteriales bacterium]|nr:hypothetical protein [Terriglobales bacterium]
MAGRFQVKVRQGLATLLLAATAISLYGATKDGSGDANKSGNGSRVANVVHFPTFEPNVLATPGMSGDVFPAIANHLSSEPPASRAFGLVEVKVSNPSTAEQPLRARVSVAIAGWSEQEFQNVDLPPGTNKVLNFAPPLDERAFHNREIAPALAQVRVQDAAGNVLYADSVPLKMRAADDMYWGERFRNASMIASWVTPHDAVVEKLLARAKEFMPGRRLPGYESWKDSAGQELSTRAQARALYIAVQKQGLSYVKSSQTFGSSANADVSQRIRMPRESVSNASANCIDGAVLFASMFENLGMQTEIIVVPGHSYVGVRVAEMSNRYLLIDAALVARVPFDEAVGIAERGITQWKSSDITRISISDARQHGIFPMPLGQ